MLCDNEGFCSQLLKRLKNTKMWKISLKNKFILTDEVTKNNCKMTCRLRQDETDAWSRIERKKIFRLLFYYKNESSITMNKNTDLKDKQAKTVSVKQTATELFKDRYIQTTLTQGYPMSSCFPPKGAFGKDCQTEQS